MNDIQVSFYVLPLLDVYIYLFFLFFLYQKRSRNLKILYTQHTEFGLFFLRFYCPKTSPLSPSETNQKVVIVPPTNQPTHLPNDPLTYQWPTHSPNHPHPLTLPQLQQSEAVSDGTLGSAAASFLMEVLLLAMLLTKRVAPSGNVQTASTSNIHAREERVRGHASTW